MKWGAAAESTSDRGGAGGNYCVVMLNAAMRWRKVGVVCSGYQSERKILTGVEPMKVQVPKVRSRLDERISRHGKPEIFNTDKGTQFASQTFTNVLKATEIKISMIEKERRVKNVIVEWL